MNLFKIIIPFAALILMLTLTDDADAQTEQQQQMRVAVSGDSVYVYHTRQVPLGEGFNIYRRDKENSEFQKINEQPVRGIMYPSELPSALGEIYDQIRARLETEDASGTFFSLRSNSILGRLYTFVHPEVAQALGRLYIDTTASAGETVTYRIEFVDDLGRPTGDEIEREFVLEETTLQPVQNLSISNDGYAVTTEWEYSSAGTEDDKVIRFEIYQSAPETDNFELVNERIILKDEEKTEYEHHFSTNRLGRQMEYMVVPVDITGQRGPAGEIAEYYLEDNIAPGVIEGVTAEYVNRAIEVTWPVSPEPDTEGYRVYRSQQISGDYSRINEELTDPLEPIYRDSSVQEGRRYFYKITAVDEAGNESAKSAAAMRRVADKTPPPAPMDLSAEYDSDSEGVSLSWQAGNRPQDFRRYIVLRRKITEDERPNFSQITRDDYRDVELFDGGIGGQGFEEGVYYEYGVAAADSSRNFSDTLRTELQVPDRTPPEPPAGIAAENRTGIRVDLSWNQTTSGDVARYVIYRQKTDSSLAEFDRVEKQNRRLRDETVEMGAEYRYAVSAVDSAGNESTHRFSDTVLVRDYDPPRRVRNVHTEPAEEGVRIHWEPVVAPDLVGYKVYRSDLSTGVFEPLTEEPIEQRTFVDSDPDGETWYRIRAVDISGNESRPSDPVRFRNVQQ